MKFLNFRNVLKIKDKNGEEPAIYIWVSNRGGGKTFSLNSFLLENFIETKQKFILLYRNDYELTDTAGKFFKSISVNFSGKMTDKTMAHGKYKELFYNDDSCGYAAAINSAATIKKLSHFFSDTQYLVFDEFQDEYNQYLSDEVTKFQSIYMSINRGNGKIDRGVKCFLVGNEISIINPYYVAFGLHELIDNKSKTIKLNGLIYRRDYNIDASNQINQSKFSQAFKNSEYINASTNTYALRDSYEFIEKPPKNSFYLASLAVTGQFFSIRKNNDIIYICSGYDKSFSVKIKSWDTENSTDFSANNVLLKKYLTNYFNYGKIRYENLTCKKYFIHFLTN